MDKNENNYLLVDNILNNKIPSTKKLQTKIRRELESHEGSYHVGYQLLKDYVSLYVDTKNILILSKEVLQYFFIELEAYGHQYPIVLFEYTLDIYEIALKAARELKDIESADDLYCMIGNGYEEAYEAFVDLFNCYFSIDDDENINLR